MNVTNNDWPLKATIQGDGFSGPSTLLAKAFMTTTYPLVFKPLREEEITVSSLLFSALLLYYNCVLHVCLRCLPKWSFLLLCLKLGVQGTDGESGNQCFNGSIYERYQFHCFTKSQNSISG